MSELVERVDEQDRVLGIVDRGEAIRGRLLHRVATIVCRDVEGRILVHRRPGNVSRFPGQYNWLLGGAVDVGETYEAAAARELAEELGVRAPVRFAFKFLCHGAISPYWLGVHEAVIKENVIPNPSEIAWHDWLPEATLREVLHQWPFVPDCQEAFTKYTTLLVRPLNDPAQADLHGRIIPRTWSSEQ
ncbi:NUDIX domain-containing protein [Streptomyces sp. NPDC041068]|uniref:NUDIX domain-containing protein n=1 Tax=Streptomyces sp. NPDC041068 TaxID=3155130 RepID=UPI0033C626BE